MADARANGWTTKRRETFLDHLAANAHVGEAAQAAGMTATGAYALRRRDEKFAASWRSALLMGYDRIEAALIRKALGQPDHAPVVDSAATGVLPAPGEIDVNVAMHLMARHRATVENLERKPRPQSFRASKDATEKTLLRHLATLEKRITARSA